MSIIQTLEPKSRVESVSVLGAFHATPEVRRALGDRMR